MSQELTTPAEVLRTAQAILRDEGWCKNVLFRASDGSVVSVMDWKFGTRRPACYCATGALMEAIRRLTGLTEGVAYRDLYGECHTFLLLTIGDSVTYANDHPLRKLPSILRYFSGAVQLAEQSETQPLPARAEGGQGDG